MQSKGSSDSGHKTNSCRPLWCWCPHEEHDIGWCHVLLYVGHDEYVRVPEWALSGEAVWAQNSLDS